MNEQLSAHLDAESLYRLLVEQLRPHIGADTALVGIHTGGFWLAQRLHQEFAITQELGSIDAAFYRDDFGAKGLRGNPKRSHIPFTVEAANILLVDDVLYTGRTTRAALNELFDYGRPARIDLAVLVDRGGRELPIAAGFCAKTLPQPLPANQNLQLECTSDGLFALRFIHA